MDAEKIKRRNKIIIIITFIIGFVGLFFISYDFVISKIRLTYETMNIRLNSEETPQVIDDNVQNTETSSNEISNNNSNNQTNTRKSSPIKMDYIAYLEIPKINLKQGLVSMNSKYNNVDQNIQIIKSSTYPDVKNGNLILAAHSGTSYISYFKNLYSVEIGDISHVTYKNIEYTYKIDSIYTVPKNGNLPIYRDMAKSTLTLITCTKDDDATQTIYIGYLV